MSILSSWITCEKCQKTYSGDFSSGCYVYEFKDGTQLDMSRRHGWCDDCWTLVEMEDLTLSYRSESLKKLRRDLQFHKSGLKKFFSKERKAAMALSERIAKLDKSIMYIYWRSSPAKCLRCGSPHVSSIPHLNWPSNSGIYIRNTWTHPGCGGTMLTHGDDTHFSETSPFLVFDPDGIFIRQVDREW